MKSFFKKLIPFMAVLSLFAVAVCSCSKVDDTAPQVSAPTGQQSGIIAKAEKYEYKGEDVMLIHVENRSDKDYILTVEGHFFDESGNELRTRTETFVGFPSGYQNYFLLQPGTRFDSFEYEITTEIYRYKTLADHLTLPTAIEYFTSPAWLNGSDVIPSDVKLDPSKLYAGIWVHPFPYVNTYSRPLKLSGYFIMFDKNGEIHMIDHFNSYAISNLPNSSGPVFQCYVYDTPMEYGVSYHVPDKLKNARWLFALTWVSNFDD